MGPNAISTALSVFSSRWVVVVQGEQQAVLGGLGDVLGHRTDRHAEVRGDFLVAQALQLRQQERPFHLATQAVEHGIDGLQQVDQHQLVLFRQREGFALFGQCVQIALLKRLATQAVDHHPARHGGQERTRIVRLGPTRTGLLAEQQAHEGVLCQIGRLARAPQPLTQPAYQPAVMVAVQLGEGGGGLGRGWALGHEKQSCN